MTHKQLKVALVKQEIDISLYVYPGNEVEKLLFSGALRPGPVALFETFDTTNILVKESFKIETQFWKHDRYKLRGYTKHVQSNRLLRTKTSKEVRKNMFSESDDCQGKFAVDVHSVNWSDFDIVISSNFAIPYEIILNNPRILWCYFIHEPFHKGYNYFNFGYDCYLNQECDGQIAIKTGNIEFPYTYLSKDTLSKIMKDHLRRNSKQSGIYAEINCTTERPVTRVEALEPLQDLHPILFHKLLIRENLTQIFDSKYFVKLGGRDIRGNSVAEAISLGALVLLDPDAMFSHKKLLPESTHIKSLNDIRKKIIYYDNNPEAYNKAKIEQQERLMTYVYEKPTQSLLNALNYKRTTVKKLNLITRYIKIKVLRLAVFLFIIFHYLMFIRRAVYHYIGNTSYKK